MSRQHTLCASIVALFYFSTHAAAVRRFDHHPRPPIGTLHIVATWSAYASYMPDHAHAFNALAGKRDFNVINYIAVNAGLTDHDRDLIDRTAAQNKLACIASYKYCIPSIEPSLNHVCALNTALQKLLGNSTFAKDDIVMFVDSDIFPVDIDVAAINFDMLGLTVERGGLKYLWPNLLVLRMTDRLLHALPDMDFGTMATPAGVGTDSGGKIAIFLQDNPWIHVSHFGRGDDHPYSPAATFVDRIKRSRSKFPQCHQSELFSSHAATFIHLGSASSNWRHCPEAVLAQSWHLAVGFVAELDNCIVESVTYESSEVERWWLDKAAELEQAKLTGSNISSIAAYCDVIASQHDTVLAIVAPHASTDDLNATIFSSFVTTQRCRSGPNQARSYIEPLFGVLRDPRSFCGHLFGQANPTMLSEPWYDRPFVLSRDNLVLDVSASAGSRLFFDLGASSFDQGPGGPSQKYFYESYGRLGTLFDRYIAWEANPVDPNQLFAAVPDYLFASYQYFNVPVDKNASSPKFPVNVLRSVASTRDFVSLKLDIDNSDVENVIVSELLQPDNAALLDEFFWEQHEGSIRDQYDRLLRLRKMGVRAHAWP